VLNHDSGVHCQSGIVFFFFFFFLFFPVAGGCFVSPDAVETLLGNPQRLSESRGRARELFENLVKVDHDELKFERFPSFVAWPGDVLP
jgi:hypothetical protein